MTLRELNRCDVSSGPICRVCGAALDAPVVFCRSCWDGQHCVTCGIGLARDSIWCDDHGPGVADLQAEKAREAGRLQGLARWIDNDIIRGHLRRYAIWLNELRASERRLAMTEEQTQRAMLSMARTMSTLCELIRDCTPRGSTERDEAVGLLHRVIAEEAHLVVAGSGTPSGA